MCAEVFVSLALTERLYGWQSHKRISKGIIPDRIANLENRIFYLEIERGTQDKINQKTENYRQFWRETNEEFHVLYLVKDEKTLEDSVRKLEEINASRHYLACVFLEFTEDPYLGVILGKWLIYKCWRKTFVLILLAVRSRFEFIKRHDLFRSYVMNELYI